MKKKILHHTSIMIIFAVLVTFLAASVVTYNKLNTYMQRGVREEAQYICLAMDEYGDSFLTKKLQTVSSSRVTLIRKDGTVLYDSEASPKKLANHSDRPEFIQAEKNGKSESIRYSETFAKKTFYYAVKLDDGNVLRVGKTVDSIYSTWISSLAVLGLLMLLVLILEFVFAQRQTRELIRPINDLDLEHPLNNVCYEELRPLLVRVDEQNRQIRQQVKELKEAEEIRKEFSANVSHELKTPIALIQGYAEGLKEGINDDPESTEFYCDVIIDEAGKMNRMVKNLLTLNQLEFGTDEVEFERFDIVKLVKGVIASCDILIQQVNANVDFIADETAYVWADEFKTEQVVRNYLTNAIHHVGNEKRIEVKIVSRNGKVCVSVFNSGKPIPEEDVPKLWDKFYKVDKAHTREYGGNGIGLSIVKAIMESFHQGYGVKNYDNGVEFWFELDAKCGKV